LGHGRSHAHGHRTPTARARPDRALGSRRAICSQGQPRRARRQWRPRLHEPQGGSLRQRADGEIFKTLKAELVNDAEYATQAEARRDVFAFLEAWYNRRLHSAIGYITPEQMDLTAA
jgi:transposase InsO family protein